MKSYCITNPKEENSYLFLHSYKIVEILTSFQEIAQMIDHFLLHPTITDQQILEGCEIAQKYQVATVCVKPYAVCYSKSILKNILVFE